MSEGAVQPVRRRGRVLWPPRHEAVRPHGPGQLRVITPGASTTGGDIGLIVLLALVLPMFGQSFHYMIDVPPAYYLSKAWPALTVLLVPLGLVRMHPPMVRRLLAMFAYVLVITPVVSMLQLGNGLFDALATTAKSWPLTYYFSLLGLLVVLQPRVDQIERALITLGVATFTTMVLLWLVVPASAYQGDNALSKLFVYEIERGNRIYMPMFFGNMFLFWCTRKAVASSAHRWLLLVVAACLVADVLIYKQRTAIATSSLVIVLALATSLPRALRGLVMVAAAGCVVAAVMVVVDGAIADAAKTNLGASYTIRQQSLALALKYMFGDPVRILFGVGSITRFSAVTMADVFGDPKFYLADLGWVGIIFEYGVIGTALIASAMLGSLVVAHRAAADRDPMALALRDSILYVAITSMIYSVIFTPGEYATAAALAYYMARARGTWPPPLQAAATR